MLRELFDASELYSFKFDSYFGVYERVFERFIGKGITFVEVGAGDGGSLLMWKEYFQDARVIGVDIDPGARELARHGIEIFIGDQASDEFWDRFYETVGPIDVLLDDGGHRNEQQIVTVVHALQHVRNKGVLLVEDLSTGYLPEFGNPSRYSFINFAKHLVDCVNSRAKDVPCKRKYRDVISSLEFHESIVVIHVDRGYIQESDLVENRGAKRVPSPVTASVSFRARLRFLKQIPVAGRFAAGCLKLWNTAVVNRRLARYFR